MSVTANAAWLKSLAAAVINQGISRASKTYGLVLWLARLGRGALRCDSCGDESCPRLIDNGIGYARLKCEGCGAVWDVIDSAPHSAAQRQGEYA